MIAREVLEDTWALAKRNLKVFYRDRSSVFVALGGVAIILVLYLAMLRPSVISQYAEFPSASVMADAWVIGGMLCIIPVTSAAVALGSMVKDRYTGAVRDFRASPAGSVAITGGYLVSTFVVSLSMTSLFLAIAVVWVLASGASVGAAEIAMAVGLMFPTSLFSCAMMYFLMLFVKSRAAYDGFVMLVNLLMGFFTGTYVPLGVLPDGVRDALSLFPSTQAGSLYRDVLGSEALRSTFPAERVAAERAYLGFDLFVGGFQITPGVAVLSLFGFAALFFALSAAVARRV
ncbi:MAG: ABC transporter permease [Thermoplasmatales archaeon]|mgnify:CR=1 FL=1|nr:ABC transporter permease [Thermoplasmatales archaeon]